MCNLQCQCGRRWMVTVRRGDSDFLTLVMLMSLHFNGLVQERRNSSALAMELRISCANPSICESIDFKFASDYLAKLALCSHKPINDFQKCLFFQITDQYYLCLENQTLHVNEISVNFSQNFLNTLRPRQVGRHCPDDIFQCIFLNENV